VFVHTSVGFYVDKYFNYALIASRSTLHT